MRTLIRVYGASIVSIVSTLSGLGGAMSCFIRSASTDDNGVPIDRNASMTPAHWRNRVGVPPMIPLVVLTASEDTPTKGPISDLSLLSISEL
jgi:hypothetical protein